MLFREGDVALTLPLPELPWSGWIPDGFEDTARRRLFRNWSEEGRNGCDYFHEILGHIFQSIFADEPAPLASFSGVLGKAVL